MFTITMRWIAITMLLVGLFWRSSANYGTMLQFVVCAVAAVLLVQATRMRQYAWATTFLLAACLFNPVVPVGFSGVVLRVVSILTGMLFFFSFQSVKLTPRPTIASITDRMPGSQSL